MKITINEKQDRIIKEYLDKEYGMPLKKYFDDNCENADFVLRRYFPLYRLYLKENGFDEEYVNHFTVTDEDDPRIDDLIDEIDDSHVDDFYIWLWKNRQFARHDPEASFFLTNPRLIKEKWVIHFTTKSSGLGICENGFKFGVPKELMSQLAYTSKVHDEDKTPDGYVYAYDVDKIYDGNLSLMIIENAPAAVMCQVNGIEVHHGTDREDQVIFHPSTVKNKVLLIKTDEVNGGWQVARNTIAKNDLKGINDKCKQLISPSEFNSLDGVIEWVKDNSFQYRKVIVWDNKEIRESQKMKKNIIINENQEQILIKENIKIHKGENGRKYSTQGKWDKEIECPHCGKKAYFSMSISDGEKGRGRIKVTDEDGKEKDSEVQTIGLYYCPSCHKFIARNNMT